MMEKWEYCVPQNMNFYVTLMIFPNGVVAETLTYFVHDVPQKIPKLRNVTNPAWVARDTCLERDALKRTRMNRPLTGLHVEKIIYLERVKRIKTEAIYLELVEQITKQKHVCYR